MSKISLIKIGKLLKWVWPRIPGTKRSNNLKWAIILEGSNWASFQEMLARPDHLLLFIPTHGGRIQRIPVRKTSTPRKNLESFKCRAKNMFWFRKTTKRNQKKSFASIIFIFIFHHVFCLIFFFKTVGRGPVNIPRTVLKTGSLFCTYLWWVWWRCELAIPVAELLGRGAKIAIRDCL